MTTYLQNMIKNLNSKQRLIMTFVIGILLVLLTLPINYDSNENEEQIITEEGVYKDELEVKVEHILSKVDGVGEVEVLVTYESSTQKAVYPEVEGVVVIASGGDNSVVIENITEAIQALFEVDTHKIKIMKMISTQKEAVN